MKKLFPGLVVGLTFALLMLAFSTSHAEVPDPNDVAAIARSTVLRSTHGTIGLIAW